ncbi:hypothetical protein RND81_03G026300 [Saponaria officinalis]|uniref:SWIM-type domain-containing protein n=1 Tax=Saponaria officinalis TaxID=3572 RepID=A0AAW1M714_SAPOF
MSFVDHPSEVLHLRCHRNIDSSETKYVVHLRTSGIRLADGFRSLVKEVGWSHLVDFEYADAASAIKKAMKKKPQVRKIFTNDFELDEDNSLVNVFLRDRIMRQDYEAFYELLGNDGTYCTNKYDMICAPFVGINNHTRVCLFGIGFMLNERTKIFEWLYKTFLASIGVIQPRTIMTDQSHEMSTAIANCFPKSKHRLCVWHLFKNSFANLGHFKDKLGFNKLFSRILKRCHSDEELEHCWKREKWCCAYGKDYFSVGVLSSQRSESTNNFIYKRLSKTTTLCDFYDIFVFLGRIRLRFLSIPCSLIEFGSKIHTIRAYKRFEKEFVKAMSYKHKIIPSIDDTLCYYVYTERTNEFAHVVSFHPSTNYACCTCKRFEEGGFSCHHIIFVYHYNCVDKIPLIYVLKRWTKMRRRKRI